MQATGYPTTTLTELPGVCTACGEAYEVQSDHLRSNPDAAHMNIALVELEHKRQINWWLTGLASSMLSPEAAPVTPEPTKSDLSEHSRVYFIRCGNYYKIGRSEEPVTRLKQIRRATKRHTAPEDLDLQAATLEATEPGGSTREAELHRQFAHLSVGSEWFRVAPELTEYVEHLSERQD